MKVLSRSLSLAGQWDALAIERVGAVAPAPAGHSFAVIVHRRAAFGPPRSEVLVHAGGRTRSIFAAPGTFTDLAWSPDGRRLLVGWLEADQWLFIPVRRGGPVAAVDQISAQFTPGAERAGFPQVGVDGWCCAR